MAPAPSLALTIESSVRRASRRDAAALTDLINRAYRVESFFVTGARTSEDEVRELLESGEFLLLRRHDGSLAAAVFVEADERRARFGLLAVDPQAQGLGLGRRLVAVAEAYGRALQCEAMELCVVNIRRELPPWYEKLGYRAVGTAPFPAPDELVKPCHFIVMSKPLGDGAPDESHRAPPPP